MNAQKTRPITKEIYINSVGVCIKVVAPEQLSEAFTKLCTTLIPLGSEASTHNSPRKPDIIIVFRPANSPNLTIRGNIVLLESAIDPYQSAMDVILLASKLLERELNRHNIYSVHASAVCKGGRSVVIIGQPGAGKSTTALNCCLLDNSVKYLGDNRITLNNLSEVVGMSSSMSIRRGSLFSEFGDFDLLRNMSRDTNRETFGDTRVEIQPEDLGIAKYTELPVKVDHIVLVRKLPKAVTVKEKMEAYNLLLLRLYESLSFYSDGLSLLLGSHLPIQDLFSNRSKTERLRFAEGMLDTIQSSVVEGTLGDISNHVLKQLARV